MELFKFINGFSNTPPDEYIEYFLCKQLHCLPSELAKQDKYLMDTFLYIINQENGRDKKATSSSRAKG